jgi:hypothetical protein
MASCEKPVSEQAVGDAAACSWTLVKDAVSAVVDHPGGATLTEWMISILLLLVILMFIGSLFRRRA